ncbi:MAG: DUF5336 domain-containing protein [Actinophytocola sp.]|uniref:DUF5336 domain-containing protein n=1 Tax=Actinophytocola sp. TaxID=1872138 RepID=UPI003C74B640
MTFPGGAPGGYPGQGPQQHQPGPYGPPPGGGMKLGLPTILHLVILGLGVINFFVGFADVFDGGDSYFANGSTIPAFFLLGGLFSLPAILPGDNKKPGIAPVAFSVTGMLTILFLTFSADPDVGTGTILILVFGILQGLGSVGAYLFDAGILKMPAPNPYGQPGGGFPPSGQFPAPPPQQPQPGQFGAPPGQQTTFAPQQGQFGQQPGHPGTPPGGYPQQG